MKRIGFLFFFLGSLSAFPQSYTSRQYKDDFQYFWNSINDNYCYFEKKQVDWQKVRLRLSPLVDTVTSRDGFISILEKAFYELYDHHCSLGANTPFSRRLAPTGADIWAEYIGGKPVVIELRQDFGAQRAGIRVGMEVIAVNDVPVSEAIQPFLSHAVNDASKSYALRVLLAGDHVTKRKIMLRSDHTVTDFYPDKDSVLLEHVKYPAYVESRVMGKIGYIRVNNFLYDNRLIGQFDSVLNAVKEKEALIIDMRETPSGGNTSVARAILGHFTDKDQFYQKHEYYAEEKETGVKRSWMEIVSPRGTLYKGPLVILADHWTGSIAEAITCGFDGMNRAKIIGTELARLNGSVETFTMPNTGIRFNFPTERLYTTKGLPREEFQPFIKVDVRGQKPGSEGDLILRSAITFLENKIK